ESVPEVEFLRIVVGERKTEMPAPLVRNVDHLQAGHSCRNAEAPEANADGAAGLGPPLEQIADEDKEIPRTNMKAADDPEPSLHDYTTQPPTMSVIGRPHVVR